LSDTINGSISDKNLIGFAGEYFVRYDLIMKRIIPNSPDLPWTPYDIIVYIDGVKLSIQVKTVLVEEGNKLVVDCRKSNGKDRTYTSKDYDILAVCDIEQRKVAYIPSEVCHGRTQITLLREPPKSLNGYGKDNQPVLFDDFLEFPIPSRKEATA
jgi:PD-(D/E)XK endonuclease